MAKAADAFRTISEVADDLGIQKHVLRFWEVKFAQIRPMKRGGGRRYYRPEDMELLRGIRQLLHRDGYTIKGVQKILREQGVEAVKARVLTGDEAAAAATSGRSQAPAADPSDGDPGKAKARRKKAGGRAAPLDRTAVLISIITELQACRDVLTEGLEHAEAGPATAAKPGAQRRRA
jgi:DNA-binding transcriptional MerR regulator